MTAHPEPIAAGTAVYVEFVLVEGPTAGDFYRLKRRGHSGSATSLVPTALVHPMPATSVAGAAIAAVLQMHRPTSLVYVECEDFAGCDGDARRPCEAAEQLNFGEHEVPTCGECRVAGDDGVASEFFWPCPTVRAITATGVTL